MFSSISKVKKVGVLDVGIGNISSCLTMIDSIFGLQSLKISNVNDLDKISYLIIPGVGAFDHAVKLLSEKGFFQSIRNFANRGYILGICLGMQILCDSSEEGNLRGLGLIPGKYKKFNSSCEFKVPKMGWNEVKYKKEKLSERNELEINGISRYYFVHSYYYVGPEKYILGTSNYGISYPSVIMKNNIMGAQFHPEKSHKFGQNFINYFVNKHYAS